MTRFARTDPPGVCRADRAGYTLIELLVVMGIIAFIASLAMRFAPGILERDRSVDAVNVLQGGMNKARSWAARDRLPRGIRLLVDPATRRSTEFLYVEAPVVFVPNPDGPGQAPLANGRVRFDYSAANGSTTSRTCTIQNLTVDQASQVQIGASLWFPVLGTWHTIIGGTTAGNTPAPGGQAAPLDTTKRSVVVTLDAYPDVRMGATTNYLTYHFGLYGAPRPLMGEPAVPMPKDTCIDLNDNVSSPSAGGLVDCDIVFAPNGQLVGTSYVNATGGGTAPGGGGHVFLWVRDPNKGADMQPPGGNFADPGYITKLQNGGEQMLVTVKKSGALAASPVYWPDQPTGPQSRPYYLARKAVAGSP